MTKNYTCIKCTLLVVLLHLIGVHGNYGLQNLLSTFYATVYSFISN